jgi:hypothetical protein
VSRSNRLSQLVKRRGLVRPDRTVHRFVIGVRIQTQSGWCFIDDSESTEMPSSQSPSYTTQIGSKPNGFFRFGCPSGCPAWLITQSTSGQQVLFRCPFGSITIRLEVFLGCQHPYFASPEGSTRPVLMLYPVDLPAGHTHTFTGTTNCPDRNFGRVTPSLIILVREYQPDVHRLAGEARAFRTPPLLHSS